jgi:hypothetical protein
MTEGRKRPNIECPNIERLNVEYDQREKLTEGRKGLKVEIHTVNMELTQVGIPLMSSANC